MEKTGTYAIHPSAFINQPFAAPHQSFLAIGSEVPIVKKSSFPSGEAKGQLRKLLPFNEPLNFPTLRADAIRPYRGVAYGLACSIEPGGSGNPCMGAIPMRNCLAALPPYEVKQMKKETLRRGGVYALLTIWGIFVLFPFYWMLLTSVKSYSSYNSEYIPKLFTLTPTLQNYADAFKAVPLGQYFFNTIVFTVVTTALMLIVTVLAAFAFARLNFRGKNLAFTLFLSLMMIPNELVVITNYVTITDGGLRNTFAGLILPSVTSVFYIYLLKENFAQIPDELYYAAKVDGTSDLKYLFKVMIPICQPTIVTVTVLKVIECWNSYVWPRLVTTDQSHFLVSVGIQEIRENGFGRENIPAMMAAVVVISLPLIVLFLLFHKKIMAGVARGGTKG